MHMHVVFSSGCMYCTCTGRWVQVVYVTIFHRQDLSFLSLICYDCLWLHSWSYTIIHPPTVILLHVLCCKIRAAGARSGQQLYSRVPGPMESDCFCGTVSVYPSYMSNNMSYQLLFLLGCKKQTLILFEEFTSF